MSLALFLSIWSLEPWILLKRVRLDSFLGLITTCLVRISCISCMFEVQLVNEIGVSELFA